MKRDMTVWRQELLNKKVKKPLPVLSFPGVQILGVGVQEMVMSPELQAQCMKVIADRFDTEATVSLMDLSVEAEAFGSPITLSDKEVPTVTKGIIETDSQAHALVVPEFGAGRTGLYVEAMGKALELITDRPVFGGVIGPFSLSGRLMDMTEIMIKCYEEPEMTHTVLTKAAAFIKKYVEAYKAIGANGVVIAEPAAGLLSPSLCEEFSTKYVKEIVEAVQDENFAVIYHNCGNTIPLINSILTIGASAYHFGNAIDIGEMAKLIPSDTLFMGNLSPAEHFRAGTPESVTEKTKEMLEKVGSYQNYVPSSGCDIPPMTSLDNIEAFFKVVKEYYEK